MSDNLSHLKVEIVLPNYNSAPYLEETINSGIKTTIQYQMAIMEHEIFKSGNFDTSFLETFNYDAEKYSHKDEK